MEQLSFAFPPPYALLSPREIYDSITPSLLAELKEDRRIERKPANYSRRALGDYFSMWANTSPDGGIILAGIEDDGRISGCHNIPQNALNELEKSHYIYAPDARVESKRIPVRSSDGADSFLIMFHVGYREDKVVRTAAGKAFIRRGDSKCELTKDEIRELEIDRNQIDLEKEPVALIYPDDFNMDLVQRFVQGVRVAHQLEQSHSDIQVLEHRRLGKIKDGIFRPNTACALAFAKDPVALFPGCLIKFLRFDGESEGTGANYNVIKTIPIEGPVPLLLERAGEVVKSQLREFSRLGDDGSFYSAPEYPADAWYEAIVNACVHRSYGLKNMNIFIKMFDDKLVVESPGGFPPTVTPENIYFSHSPRNPVLMHAMFYMGLVKEHAEGTKRMRDTMQDLNLPAPIFQETETGVGFSQVRVTLKNHIHQRKVWIDADVTSLLGEALAKSLSADEKRVINYLAEHKKINVTQCHRILSHLAKWHTAKRLLQRLVDKGILEHVHSKTVERDNKAHYVLRATFKDLEK
jgi:ATP-dependent DNA helicase RecG